MSEVIRCDWCGATTKENAMVNWFSVSLDARGFRVRTSEDEPGPWHFCTPVCLQSWAFDRCTDHDREKAGVLQGSDTAQEGS